MPAATLTLTRGHLLALGALSLALAVLTFFLGVEVGRKQAPPPPIVEPPGLVAKEVAEGNLEELLSKAEEKQGQPLDFPKALIAPPIAADGVPGGGWAIQVGEFPDDAGADALVAKLRGDKLAAYKIAAVVEGHPRLRVRVGGYGSRESATAAQPQVVTAAGVSDGVVVPAP